MKVNNDSLGERIKSNYENRSKTGLIKRMPAIIRLDGCHFHTFTNGFMKPFDNRLIKAMQDTTLSLCKNIQGCVLGYTQSDEITLVLNDYYDINVMPWYDYEVQKMCSVSASIATVCFNSAFRNNVNEFVNKDYKMLTDKALYGEETTKSMNELLSKYNRAISVGATFDARCFNVPENDLVNAILWRVKDATRNSINSYGQAHFTHRELHGKKTEEVQEMLFSICGLNWNNEPNHLKCGTFVVKDGGKYKIKDVCIKTYTDLEAFLKRYGIINDGETSVG